MYLWCETNIGDNNSRRYVLYPLWRMSYIIPALRSWERNIILSPVQCIRTTLLTVLYCQQVAKTHTPQNDHGEKRFDDFSFEFPGVVTVYFFSCDISIQFGKYDWRRNKSNVSLKVPLHCGITERLCENHIMKCDGPISTVACNGYRLNRLSE